MKKYRVAIYLALVGAALISAVAIFFPEFYQTFEVKTLDLRFKLRGPLPVRPDIIFIEIDDHSIHSLGRWPWPREKIANILETLDSLGAKKILLDILFTEPSQLAVDKKELEEALRLEENKRSLDSFVDQALIRIEKQEADKEEITSALARLKNEAGIWEKDVRKALSSALRDDDITLAEAIQKSGRVYLGFHSRIIQTKDDMIHQARLMRAEKKISAWIEKNHTASFAETPYPLGKTSGLKQDQLHTLFSEIKLKYLLNRNLELSFEEARGFFAEEDPVFLRPIYNRAKSQIYKEGIERIFKEIGPLGSDEVIARFALFNNADIKLLKDIYAEVILEDIFREKIGIPPADKEGFYQILRLTPPILPLTQAMKSCGHVDGIFDHDGTLRKLPLLLRYKDRLYPNLSLSAALDLLGVDPKKGLRLESRKALILGHRSVPIDSQGRLLLNWPGKWQESFLHLPAAEVFRLWELTQAVASNKQLLAEEAFQDETTREMINAVERKEADLRGTLAPQIKDKICIIGLTETGTQDYIPTPQEANSPAVFSQAVMLNSILEGKFLSRSPSLINYMAIFILAIISALIASALPAGLGVISIMATAFFWCVFSYFIFIRQGIWVDITGPLASISASYVAAISYNFAKEAKEKRWIRNVFSHYISKDIMEEILKDPAKLKLGGQTKELTVLFADVRGFTAYSEKHRAEEVVAILNEYLDAMTKVIFKHGGTLDKYVGDEIVAIFGAPAFQSDHPGRAVRAALEMIEHLSLLRKKWRAEAKEPLDIGIGINTGPMIVGNMGSAERMNYTAIGDAVNLAARIQALTREYDNHIMISEFTYIHTKDTADVKPLGEIKVKGKEKSVMMYEIKTPPVTSP